MSRLLSVWLIALLRDYPRPGPTPRLPPTVAAADRERSALQQPVHIEIIGRAAVTGLPDPLREDRRRVSPSRRRTWPPWGSASSR